MLLTHVSCGLRRLAAAGGGWQARSAARAGRRLDLTSAEFDLLERLPRVSRPSELREPSPVECRFSGSGVLRHAFQAESRVADARPFSEKRTGQGIRQIGLHHRSSARPARGAYIFVGTVAFYRQEIPITIDTVQSFSCMLRKASGEHLKPGAETFVQIFAEDGVMEFPCAPPGVPQRVEGRRALAAPLAFFASLVEFSSVSDVANHKTRDPEI